jgi:Rod binding domain-containing protein
VINLSNNISSINTNNSTNTNNDDYQKQLRKTSDEFASMYIYEVFKKMYDTVPKRGFLQDSFGESWFREMLLQDYALKSAKTDLKSISDMIYKSLGGEETSQDSENSQNSQN